MFFGVQISDGFALFALWVVVVCGVCMSVLVRSRFISALLVAGGVVSLYVGWGDKVMLPAAVMLLAGLLGAARVKWGRARALRRAAVRQRQEAFVGER